jgi:formylglycine-generating enzyme required for sulfatase activity
VQDYQAFVTATGRNWEKPSFDQGPTHPAVNVSWEDAKAFCAWLTKKEQEAGKIGANQKYRLPTDAEWSVAVGLGAEPGNTPEERHGKIKDVYPWGNQWPPLQGAGNYDGSLKVDKFKYTSPVGSFTANPVGLFDMGGNVWEWCEDSYRLGDDWRLLRGASWLDDYPFYLLSSYRSHFDPGNPSVIIGFRCVLVVGGASSSSR